MRKRTEISDELREKLLGNDSIAAVSKYNIYLTPEFKEMAYKKLNEGTMILKIFYDAKLPVVEPLLSRSRHMRNAIMKQGKTGNFERKNKPATAGVTNSERRYGVNPEKYEFVCEQLEFLKKIAKLEGRSI